MNTNALYEEIILDHNRSPRNFGELPGANRTARGHNPMCGDQLTLWLRMDGDTIADARFTGEGCAISKASASMMTQAIKGKSRAEAEDLFERFHALVTGKGGEAPDKSLGSLRAFAGVARFPMRVKCASLAWHALKDALSS
ncbi:MAG TPA: SUF system NifU family Fe-S cluster assembly protein [Gemmatimonadaceae bacterium]